MPEPEPTAEPTTQTEPATTEPTPDAPAAATAADPAAELDKWRALARKHEARAKENATAAQRLAEIEEASKTEAHKAAEAAQRTAKERDDALAEAAKLRAAVKFGLSEDDLSHLDGIPAERVEAIAEWVASRTPPKTPAAPPADGQGKVGKPVGVTDIDTQIKAANEAGDWRRALSLTNTKLADQAGKD